MNFRVGQKVAYVNDDDDGTPGLWGGTKRPQLGKVYTIRGLYTGCDGRRGVVVEGIINPISPWTGREFGFAAYRFRPVVEIKTDISIFTKMLTDTRINERV